VVFQDDRMISFLSAIVIMVAIGTVIQKADGIPDLFGPSEPTFVFREDAVIAVPGVLQRIEVFENDSGADLRQRRTLYVVERPACGEVFVQGDVLQYLPTAGCRGRQTIHYSVADAPEGVFGVVTAMVQAPDEHPEPGQDAAPSPLPRTDALTEDGPLPPEDDGTAVLNAFAAGSARADLAAEAQRATDPAPADAPSVPSAEAAPRVAAIDRGDILVAEDAETGAAPSVTVPAPAEPVAALAPDADQTGLAAIETKKNASAPLRLAALDPLRAGPEVSAARHSAVPSAASGRPVGRRPQTPAPPGRRGLPAPADALIERPIEPAAATPETPVAWGAVKAGGLAAPSSGPGAALPHPTLRDADQIPDGLSAPDIAAVALPHAKTRAAPIADPAAEQARREPAPKRAAPTPAAIAGARDVDPAPLHGYQPGAPETRLVAASIGEFDSSGAPAPSLPDLPLEAPATDTAPATLMLALGPVREPVATVPGDLRVRMTLDRSAPAVEQRTAAALAAAKGPPPRALAPVARTTEREPALDTLPLDPEQGPPRERTVSGLPEPGALPPIPPVRNTAALDTAAQRSEIGRIGDSLALKTQTATPEPAALRKPEAPCTTPPATTLDIDRGAETRVLVVAPCHAGTVAELTYAGLRLAVPLDETGQGGIVALGFEPTSPALLIFDNGEKIDFDLPFRGIDRVQRVALIWDDPIALELNALEFGAAPGTDGHVSTRNRKSFQDVRRTGGGYLASYQPRDGVGQNVQVYTFWQRRGGATGVVEMKIDFASRDRERLEGTCGDGPYAAPRFLVLRSEHGRLERPVIRQLMRLPCSKVHTEDGDNRLISDAVSDLVVAR